MSKHEPRGKVGADGKFQVETALKPGAPAGRYKVGVIINAPADPQDPYAVLKSVIDKKYNDPETSGFVFEVVPSPKDGAYDLKIAAKADDTP